MVEQGGIYITRPIPFSIDAPNNAKTWFKSTRAGDSVTHSVSSKSAVF